MQASRVWARNTLYLAVVESFWGLGMNLVSMGTVLPVLLQQHGASNGVIAFIPALSALGMGLPQLVSGFLVGRSRTLKPWVLWLHVFSPLPLVLLALGLLLRWAPPVPLVLAGWGLFYAWIGLLFPVWLDYMGKILDPARRGRALGLIFFTQTVAGALGVTLTAALLEGGTSLGRYALLFGLAAALMSGGSFFFLGTREDPEAGETPAPPTLAQHVRTLAAMASRTRWLRLYLCARWLVRGGYPLILHFFAVYAVAKRGASPAEAALYGTAGLAAQALAGVTAGFLGDRLGHKVPVLLGQGCLLVSCALILFPLPAWIYFVVAALTGASLAAEYTSQTAWIMDLAAPGERQATLALVGFMLTPAAVLAPLAGGFLMDRVGFPAVTAFVAVVLVAAMVMELAGLPARRPTAGPT